MRAVRIHAHGGLDQLKFEELEDPKPKGHEVLLKIKACALNHLDIWVRMGIPGVKIKLPQILGSDISGTIAQVGEEVKHFKVGDEVVVSPGTSCGHCLHCLAGHENLCRFYGIIGETQDGGYAEFVSLPSQNVLLKPRNISLEKAAALPLVYLTAWHMLVTLGKISPEKWVLIQAAGSGVGSAAIQIAKLFGANIIATAGSNEKLDKAKELGAHFLINYTKEDFSKRVMEITKKQGVDIVFEHTGEKTFEGSYKSLCKGGRLMTCGATTGFKAVLDLRYLFSKHLKIIGSTMGTKAELSTILNHVEKGHLKPVIDRTFPLKDAAKAHQHLEERKNFGKVLLLP